MTRTANALVQYALKRGFRTFRNRSFRASVQFHTLDQVEQDRMFNELVASNLVLIMLMLDTFAKLSNRGMQEYIRQLCNAIPLRFAETLRKTGVADEHTRTWLKLLDLRRDEYEEQRLSARSSLPEFGEGNPWMRVVGVGCLFHIRRGKPDTSDPLLTLCMEDSIAVSAFTTRLITRTVHRL